MTGIDEKNLRGITVNGKDLLGCLEKEESNEYFEEEGKGKALYHKSRVTYKSKTERHGKVHQWTLKEIEMYECKTAAEMVLLLLKTEDEVSARSAKKLLKDHPKKPGARGIAIALQRIYQKMEFALRKRFVGREVFYSFERNEYKDIDLKNLFSCYQGKLTWDEISPIPRTEVNDDTVIMQDIMDLAKELRTLVEYSKNLEQRVQKVEEKPSGQRLDVYFHFNFGKED